MIINEHCARALVLLTAVGCFSNAPIARAQTEPLPTRIVDVQGVQMRVLTAGLRERRPGQPVIVLEAGADADLETWKPIFAETARLAPVVAYDRRGLGRSGADTEPPTLKRSAQTLHAVLQQLQATPPYLLVGHSWGGLIIRGFSDLYANETVGLVYLDVPDFETTRQERAAALPIEERQRALGPPDLPSIPANTSAGLRAVFEQMLEEMRNDYPTARTFRQPSGIPVAVVITTRADRLKGNGGAMVRLQIDKQSEWALGSRNGLFVLAGHTGHQVHRDDPALVLDLIAHIHRQVVAGAR